MKKKYQVFISSTYKDMVDERFEVMQTLLSFNCMPAGMELFPAANESQWNFIRRVIDESDYYLIILGGKYGSIHADRGISYTRMEFEYALSIGKPILRFLIKDPDKLPQDKIEKDPKIQRKLNDFRKVLMSGSLCKFYENPKDLALQVTKSIMQLIESYPAAGWIPFHQWADANMANQLKEREVMDFDEVKSQLEKTVIYKMINLRSVDALPDVIYEKYIPRLNKKIGVSSEYVSVKINRFDKLVNHFKNRDRTSGTAIEVNSLLPFRLMLEDGDKRATLIEPLIKGPSDTYVTSAYFYNGFKAGDLDLGIKAEKDTEIVRLVVDFSSIPCFGKMFTQSPRLIYRRYKPDTDVTDVGNLEDEDSDSFKELAPGVFYAEMKKMKKEEGLRFEFSTDVETASNLT